LSQALLKNGNKELLLMKDVEIITLKKSFEFNLEVLLNKKALSTPAILKHIPNLPKYIVFAFF